MLEGLAVNHPFQPAFAIELRANGPHHGIITAGN
jgi:hypothetical protein